jgi:hypothetical protein
MYGLKGPKARWLGSLGVKVKENGTWEAGLKGRTAPKYPDAKGSTGMKRAPQIGKRGKVKKGKRLRWSK